MAEQDAAVERYWSRERSAIGRLVNDVLDGAQAAADWIRVRLTRGDDPAVYKHHADRKEALLSAARGEMRRQFDPAPVLSGTRAELLPAAEAAHGHLTRLLNQGAPSPEIEEASRRATTLWRAALPLPPKDPQLHTQVSTSVPPTREPTQADRDAARSRLSATRADAAMDAARRAQAPVQAVRSSL